MEMEELLEEWKDFKLSEKENESRISLKHDVLTRIKGKLNRCLTGKLLSSRPISKTAIKNALAGAWKTRGF